MNTSDWALPSPRKPKDEQVMSVPPDGWNPLNILSPGISRSVNPETMNASGRIPTEGQDRQMTKFILGQ